MEWLWGPDPRKSVCEHDLGQNSYRVLPYFYADQVIQEFDLSQKLLGGLLVTSLVKKGLIL